MKKRNMIKFSKLDDNMQQIYKLMHAEPTATQFSKEGVTKSDALRKAFKEELGLDGEDRIAPLLDSSIFSKNERLFELVGDYIQTQLEVELGQEDSFFTFQRVDWGDKKEYRVENPSLFKVFKPAIGDIGFRAQSLPRDGRVEVEVKAKGIRFEQQFRDFMTMKVKEFSYFVNLVAKSFINDTKVEVGEKIFTIGVTQADKAEKFLGSNGGNATAIDKARKYVETENVGVSRVTVLGTITALKETYGSLFSDSMLNEIAQQGYLGNVDGMTLVALDQFKDRNTGKTVLPEDHLLLLPTESEQFVHIVQEGSPVIWEQNMSDNKSLKKEYVYLVHEGNILATGDARAIVELA